MSGCNTKTKAVMVVLVGLFGLLCVGFAVSVTEKYRLQKERVHGLERQLGAGKKEVLKVPELMESLDKTETAKKEVEEKFSACSAEKDGLAAKAAELQKEVDTFGAIKVAVGVQIGGLQNVTQDQQGKISAYEEEKNKLLAHVSTLEGEMKNTSEKFELQITDIKRGQEATKNQLIYYTEAKKISDKEIEEKQKLINELQHELARIKGQGAGETSQAPAHKETKAAGIAVREDWNVGAATEELDKTFALLRERVTSPAISLSEVSILLSRAEKALKNLR
jgi:hypothetical protein